MTASPAVAVSDLVVQKGTKVLVGPVSFELPSGGSLGLRGPSGAGKSTVVRTLVGLLPEGIRATGRVQVLGTELGASSPRSRSRTKVDLPRLRARAGLVGQSPVVFPASILANAAFGLRHQVRAPRAELRRRAEAALAEAGLWEEVADRLDSPAEQLSLGQRQRLCLARALALDPELLILDEPTSALDEDSGAVVESAVRGLERRRSVLVVSHDRAQLDRLCDEVVTIPTQPL